MSAEAPDAAPARIRVERLGVEGVKVLIIERLVSDPTPLLDVAYHAVYGEPQVRAFPGLRAPAPRPYLQLLIETLTPMLQDVFGLKGWRTTSAVSDFSLVTRPAERLAPVQRIPHTDGHDPGLLALLHYLTPGDCFGTSFYRHRTTGFERVSAHRREAYQSQLAAEMKARPPTGYAVGDGPLFERTGGVAGVFNRLIAYQGYALHSGDVPPEFTFEADPRRGRLTANTFLVLRPPLTASDHDPPRG
jgi:hypothetical protein